ncbi:MAG: substrate-binding domain-containing protein [Hespellia sp.]|nr:substrate-binding domain-containing protein [Hespellia sp.]
MKMKKFVALVSVVSMLAVAATGCGNTSADSASGSTADSASGSTADGASGSDSAWDSSMDITVVSREDGSGTRGAFIELFGVEEKDASGEKVDNTTTDAQITNSTSVMMTTVAGDEYAIGYVSLGSLDDSVKAVKIDGAEATAENVKSGDYKVTRPFNIVTKEGMNNEVATDFISFIMSTEGQKVVEDNGYIAVDDVTAYAGSKPSGKCVVGGSSSVSPVMEKLVEAYKAVNTNAEIELQTTDSTTGVTSTQDGSYDIGMASRELKAEETGVTATVIATDGIAVVVNNDSTVDELTTEQVKSIYTGEALTWDEVLK